VDEDRIGRWYASKLGLRTIPTPQYDPFDCLLVMDDNATGSDKTLSILEIQTRNIHWGKESLVFVNVGKLEKLEAISDAWGCSYVYLQHFACGTIVETCLCKIKNCQRRAMANGDEKYLVPLSSFNVIGTCGGK